MEGGQGGSQWAGLPLPAAAPIGGRQLAVISISSRLMLEGEMVEGGLESNFLFLFETMDWSLMVARGSHDVCGPS